jgi:hypothetical protein
MPSSLVQHGSATASSGQAEPKAAGGTRKEGFRPETPLSPAAASTGARSLCALVHIYTVRLVVFAGNSDRTEVSGTMPCESF